MNDCAELAKVRDDLTPVAATADRARSEVQALDLTSQEGYDLAGGMMRQISDAMSALEASRQTVIGPLNQSVRATNELFRVPRKALEDVRDLLTSRLTEAKLEADERLSAAVISQDHQAIVDAAAPQASTMVAVSYVDFEVVDMKLVPQEYLEIRKSPLLVAIRAGEVVPGVRRVEGTRFQAKPRRT